MRAVSCHTLHMKHTHTHTLTKGNVYLNSLHLNYTSLSPKSFDPKYSQTPGRFCNQRERKKEDWKSR